MKTHGTCHSCFEYYEFKASGAPKELEHKYCSNDCFEQDAVLCEQCQEHYTEEISNARNKRFCSSYCEVIFTHGIEE